MATTQMAPIRVWLLTLAVLAILAVLAVALIAVLENPLILSFFVDGGFSTACRVGATGSFMHHWCA